MPGRRRGLSPATLAAAALALLPAYAAAASGALGDPRLAVAVALGALLVLPGLAPAYGWARGRSGVLPELLAVAAGLGVAVNALAAWIAHLLGQSFFFLAWASPIAGAALTAILVGMDERPALAVRSPGRRRAAWLLPCLLAGLAAAVALAAAPGPPESVHSDTPAHTALVRRAAMTGSAFPEDAFYRDAGRQGRDPRAGLFHPLLAVVVRVTDLEPLEVWRHAPVALAPFLLLSIFSLTRAIAGRRGPALLAAAASLLFLGGAGARGSWNEAVYPVLLGQALWLLVLASGFRYLRCGARRELLAAAGLAFAAVATHVFAAVAMLVAGAATLFGVSLDALATPDKEVRAEAWLTFRRGLLLSGAVALATAPYLAWRYATAYAPADPLHLEPQGLLDWGGPRLFSAAPGSVWHRLGVAAVALPFAALWLWGERRRGAGYAYLAVVTLFVPLAVLHPMLFPLLYDRLGYLAVRLVDFIPASVTLGLALWWAAAAWRRGERTGASWVLGSALVAAGWQCWLSVEDGRRAVPPDVRLESAWRSRVSPALERLRRHSGPLVVASDPALSYLVPAVTGHYVTAVMPQHGSPNDSLGEARIVRARDWFLPRVSPEATARGLGLAGADLFLVDASPMAPRIPGPWVRNPEFAGAVLDKLASRPDLFRLEPWGDGLVIALPASGEWPVDEPTPDRLLGRALDRSAGAVQAAVRHESTRVDRAVAAPGEALTVETAWRRVGALPPGAYVVEGSVLGRVRSQPWYQAWYGKLYRRLAQAWTGKRRYAESFHLPADGLWPPETWPASQAVRDSFAFPLPADLTPGIYDLRLRFHRVAHHPNQRLVEWLSEDDKVWGPPVATVEVRVAAAEAAP